MASFIPLVTGPQAVVWADRAASTSVLSEAAAQLSFPLNRTQTLQLTFCAESVLYARKAAKRRTTPTVRSVFGFNGGYFPLGRLAVSSPLFPSATGVTWVVQPSAKVTTRRKPRVSAVILATWGNFLA
jgi:hypothetical protein